MSLTPVKDAIQAKLEAGLTPQAVEIVDESDLHAGHAGAREGGESHFRVTVISAEFTRKNRIERQRLVYTILAAEMAGPVHALSLTTLAPGEPAK